MGFASSAFGANLLQNAGFETHDSLFGLQNWQLYPNGNPAAVSPAIKVSTAGNIVLQINEDPSGSNFVSPQIMAQQSILLPASAPRLVLTAQIARDPESPGPGKVVGFAIRFATAGGPASLPFDLDSDILRADGDFHPITGRVVLPPNYQAGGAQLMIVKSGAGRFWLDGLSLEAATTDFGVQPGRGPSQGGIPVQLQGAQMGPGVNVFFNNVPAPVQNASPGQVTAMLPPNPPGTADARVVLPGGGIQVTQRAAFFYLEPITISSFSPQTGPTAGGAQLHFDGTGFLPPVQISFNGVPAAGQPTVLSSQELLFISPPLTGGMHTVQFTDAYGRMATAAQPLVVSPAPQVSSVTPTNGPAEGGTAITILGSGFAPGATVRLGYTNANSVLWISGAEIQCVTPPNFGGLYDVVVQNADAVSGTLSNAFTYEGKLPGDVNGDLRVDLSDVMRALQISAGESPSIALNLDSDANGDGRIGLEEAVLAFELSESYLTNAFALQPSPTLAIPATGVTNGTPVAAFVGDLGHFAPGTIHWGDGFTSEFNTDGFYTHLYDGPGNFNVSLETGYGAGPTINVTVYPTQTLHLVSAALTLTGSNVNGLSITGRVAVINTSSPPAVTLQLVGEGTGVANGILHVDAPSTNDTFVPVTFNFTNNTPGPHTNAAQFNTLTFAESGVHYVTFNLAVDTDATVDAAHSAPVTVVVPSSVLETNCAELQAQWEALVAEKAAKQKDCAELAQKIADLQAQKADLQAQQNATQEQRDQAQADLDALQADFDQLFDYVNAFLGGAGLLIQYSDTGDFPSGDNHIGARITGASGGIGISFSNPQALLNQMQLYAEANGHSLAQDLSTLRKQIKQMDALNQQIADADAKIADLQNQMDAIDQQIADLQNKLADCEMECDDLQADIDALVAANEECLEQLEKARKAEAAIREAEQAGEEAKEQSDDTTDAANQADETIDERSGSAGQKQADHDEVQSGRDKQDEADDLIEQGEQKLDDAKNAATPEEAESLADEAKDLFEQAKEKLDDANGDIKTGESRAENRKPIECTDGAVEMGPVKSEAVWTDIIDFTILPIGYTPETWASAQGNIDSLLAGFRLIFAIIEEAEDFSPIALTFTPDADEAAEAIINAHLELLKGRVECNVWFKLRGHTVLTRTDKICVNGCWTTDTVVTHLNDMLIKDEKVGKIFATTKAEREAAVKKIITNWLYHHRTGTKP